MMKNLILKRTIFCAATLLALIFALYFASLCFMRNETYDRYQTFKKSKTDYDVLFFGSSHVLNAVSPMQLWEEHGITSYNLSWHSITIIPSYWLLQITEKYHKPKIAVIDILGINFLSTTPPLGFFHGAFDEFPLSFTKIKATKDLFEDKGSRTEVLFPFYSYHNRWKESTPKFHLKNGAKRLLGLYEPSTTKGMDLRIGVKTEETFNMTVNAYEGKESAAIDYAKKFIDYCHKNDIIPVFMLIPYSEQRNLFEWRDAFKKILEEENVTFLDMTSGIVDFYIDQYDQNSHMNPSGARKVTAEIGKFLSEKYALKSHKEEPSFESWKADYERYIRYIQEKITEQEKLENLLMMLNNSQVYANVEAKNSVELTQTEKKLIFENTSEITFERNDNIESEIKVNVFSKKDNSLLCEKKFVAGKIYINE